MRTPGHVRPNGFEVPLIAVFSVVVLGAGLAVRVGGDRVLAGNIWLAGLVLAGAPLVWRTLRGIARGQFASDIVATLAIVGAVLLAEPVAGLVVVLMQSGGEALERYAEGRASAAVRALEQDAPRIAHRLRDAGGAVDDIIVDEIVVGDRLLVRPGEMVPCDAVVDSGRSHVDTSRLTGEPIPITAGAGAELLSGSLNIDGPLTIRATAVAGESQYARIVSLVRSAQESKAPLQRLADRYAVWFTPLTLAVCAIAWLGSGDAQRVLAVLVVATPCPLILATPVAIIGGINRAARQLVVVRHGGALEQLASVSVAVFDKTGTLTVGSPEVRRVLPLGGRAADEVLGQAASVEEGSGHLLARSVVRAASSSGVALTPAHDIRESAGRGVLGTIGGREVIVGSRGLVEEHAPSAMADFHAAESNGGLRSFVVIGGEAAGIIEYADQLRPGLHAFFDELRSLGIERLVLLSGDSLAHTQAVAEDVGITEARGDLLPGDKVAVVGELAGNGAKVVMVGDGTNDAPALTTADVGIALAGHGGGIVAEAADIVVLGSDVTRVAGAIRIARRTLRIAKQSIWVGLGLSGVAMAAAAVGLIEPVPGALLQEAIDVAVIVNALRTSRSPREEPRQESSHTTSGLSRQIPLPEESTLRV
jgi:heavy metal translocating P-type ATPase